MKVRYSYFIAKANIKGNRKSTEVSVLMLIMTLSLTLVSVFSVTITDGLDLYKNELRARMLYISPFRQLLDEDILEQVRQIEHVEWIDMQDEMRYQLFDVEDIKDENGIYEEVQRLIDQRGGFLAAWSLVEGEHKQVIAGDTLDESPMFSCIVPSLFYPFDVAVYDEKDLEYLDAESLIGKTLTVSAEKYGYWLDFNWEDGEGTGTFLPGFKLEFKIVGVYYATATGDGGPDEIFISEETGKRIQEMAVENAGWAVKKYYESPNLHNYHVIVDDYENLDYVRECLGNMNVDCYPDPELGISKGKIGVEAIFHAVSRILTIGTLLLCLVNVFQSATNMLISRKGELGLMKAIGYKDRAIFCCIALEQILLTLRGYFVGAGISAIVIAIANYINEHNIFTNRLYIVSWADYAKFLGIALVIAVLMPLICEGIALKKLERIQPKDAMS